MWANVKAMAATLAVIGTVGAGGGQVAYKTVAAEAPAMTPAPGVTILRMAKQWRDPTKDPGGTIWRYFETWQTDVVRMDSGELVRVEPFVLRRGCAHAWQEGSLPREVYQRGAF